MKKETKNWMEKFSDVQNYQLYGNGDNYTQSIDRDQAVYDSGKAAYKSYTLIDLQTGERETVTAEQMEAFAKKW
ncbi:MAG TPA: hypothetical protein GX745_09070 [Clostridiales bacterium]|nr:hypothetical protein [Clostridiales bacterium]